MVDNGGLEQRHLIQEGQQLDKTPRRLTLHEAQEILVQVGDIDPTTFTSLKDMAKLGRFQDAFAVVATHILLNTEKVIATNFHLGAEGQIALKANWYDENESQPQGREVTLYFTPEQMARARENPEAFLAHGETPAEIQFLTNQRNLFNILWLNYQEGKGSSAAKSSPYQIKVQRDDFQGSTTLQYNNRHQLFSLRNGRIDSDKPEKCLPAIAEEIKEASQIMVARSRNFSQGLQRPTNLPPLLPPAPGR